MVLARGSKLFPGLSHLFKLLPVTGWCRARHVATFGSMLQILVYFFHIDPRNSRFAANARMTVWFRKSVNRELPWKWRVSMETSRVAIWGRPLMHNLEPGLLAKAGVVGVPGAVTASNHPPRILIIEDEALISLMIGDMVQELGYRVSGIANTMAVARREFAKRNYDAVLLDINIGGRYHAETADHLLGWGHPVRLRDGLRLSR
ncbi:MAG: hypothetical protein WB390_08245 [Pseudolabrys sp.]